MKNKPNLHFLGANGFPASVYRKCLNVLAHDFTVSSTDMLGHDPKYPIDDNLKSLTQEVIDLIKSTYQAPIFAVGHSFGGTLFYMAAKKCPELFAGIIIMDSLIVSGVEATLFSWAKFFNIYHHFGPAALSQGRRARWPDRQSAINYFATKKLFAHFDPECLQDYVDFGMQALDSGEMQLKFLVENEVAIFNHYPHKFGRTWPVKMPAAFFYGKDSNVIQSRHVQHMTQNVKMQITAMPGTHMFPLEHPENTALAIKQQINSMICG